MFVTRDRVGSFRLSPVLFFVLLPLLPVAFERQSSHAVTPKILQEINTYPFKTNRTRDIDNTERGLEVRNRIRTLIF